MSDKSNDQGTQKDHPAAGPTPSPPHPFTSSPLHPLTSSPPHPLLTIARALATGPVLGLVTVLTVFIVLLAWQGEPDALANFLSLSNVQVLVHSITPKAVLALGMLLIMVSGGIDLSVGSVVALVTVVTMVVYRLAFGFTGSQASASLIAVTAGVATGGLSGLANGAIITGMRVSPFVTTLGMMSIARGLAHWLADRKAVSFGTVPRPGWIDALPSLLGLADRTWHGYAPMPAWVGTLAETFPDHGYFNAGSWSLVPLAVAVFILLRATVLGRYTYAIGSNEATARLCGVSINRTKVVIYTLAGLLGGWAGVLSFTQVGGQPGGSMGLELEVIAAVVIGGASLGGGQGGVGGVLLGVLILGILNNGVNRFNLPVEIQYILIGGIIIVNTALSRWRQRE